MLKKIFVSIISVGIFSNTLINNSVLANDTKTFSVRDSKITVQKGSNFIIRLESNSSTGYKWDLSKPLDSKKIKLVKSIYQNPEQKDPSMPIVGASGMELWEFSPLKSGTTSITLKYHRPWEKSTLDSEQITFKINIKD